MSNEFDNKILIGIFTLIAGVYTWLLRHIKKHPCADELVFKDVCEANRDCIETQIAGLKELLGQRFDNLEELVKKNGHG